MLISSIRILRLRAMKAKLFLDMIFFKLFAFVFRSIKIKLAEIFIIKRLTLFIYFFSKHFISKTLSSTPLLTFASRESSLFPSIREPVTIAPEIRALQKQAFLGAWTLFPLGCRKLRRRTREVDRTADINKNSLTWVNHHLYPMEKASNEDKSKRTTKSKSKSKERKKRGKISRNDQSLAVIENYYIQYIYLLNNQRHKRTRGKKKEKIKQSIIKSTIKTIF